VYEDGANADDFGGLHSSQDSIAQHRGSKSLSLKMFVNGETAKDHHRHWIGHVALDLSGGACMSNRSRRKSVVTDDSLSCANHIGTRCAALLVLHCPAMKPVVESGFATFKFRNLVLGGQPLGQSKLWLRLHLSQGA